MAAVNFWGGRWYLLLLMVPQWKMTVSKSKVMRTQPLHPIQPKPNSKFKVSDIAMYQASF